MGSIVVLDSPAASIARQMQAARDCHRFVGLGRAKRKPSLKQADVDAAVNAVVDDLDREFRRLGVEFPKLRQAYDVARATVQRKRAGAAK
jgi:hypothetical protein